MEKMTRMLQVLCCFYAFCATTSSITVPENDLIRSLLDDYQPLARPALNPEEATEVRVNVAMQSMLGIDERNTLFVANMWIHMAWNDIRLTWNKTEVGKIENLAINTDLIWTPDLVLRNSYDDFYSILEDKRFRATVKFDGSVDVWFAGKVTVLCALDMTYFPIDKQACYLQLNSWSSESDVVRLISTSDTVHVLNDNHPQWEITSSKVHGGNESFPDGTNYESLFYFVYVTRRPLFFAYTIVIPCTCLSLVSMVMFCLPPDGGEKVSLGVTILLSFVVFQLLISDILPRSSGNVPLLYLYAAGVEFLTSLSVVCAVFSINLHFANCQMPRAFRVFTFSVLAKMVFIKPPKTHEKLQRSMSNQSTHSTTTNFPPEVNHNNQHTNAENGGVITHPPHTESQGLLWQEASRVWDRFFLFVCITFLIGFFVVLFFIYPSFQHQVEPVIIS